MRFYSLLRGEYWALKRNKRIMLFIGMMIAMAIIWAMDSQDTPSFLPTLIVVSTYTSTWQMTVTSLVEEKEHRTLEALLVTPARPLEIVAAKASVGALMATLLTAVTLLVFRQAPGSPLVLLIGYLTCLGFGTASGALVGIAAKDLKTSSLFRTPILAVLVGATIVPWQDSRWAIAEVMRWLPMRPVQELLWGGWTGAPVPVAQNVTVMLAYTLALLAAGTSILRKQATDR